MDNPTIINVLQNVHKMLENRGLDIEMVNRTPPMAHLNKVIKLFRDGSNSLDIFIENTNKAKSELGKKAYVHFIHTLKNEKSTKEIEDSYDVIKKAHNMTDRDHIIMVIFQKFSEATQDLELEYGNLTIFTHKNLMFNIVEHEFVPTHQLLEADEKVKLLSDFMITNYDKLPLISKSDPVCRYYNFRENDVIRVIRPSNADKSHVSYRYVKILV